MTGSAQRFWVAMVLTLTLHAIVLLVLWMQPAGRYAAAAAAFIPVEFADAEAFDAVVPTLEDQLRAQMESRVANLVADATATASSELQSTGASDEARMAAEVAAELRALELAEFERLAQEEKDFGLEGVPDDGQNSDVNTLSGWDRRYEGRVTVSYNVENRKHVYLPIPGYQCLEAGTVVVEVEIARNGDVVKARIVDAAVGEGEACLHEAALKYAQRSVFEPRTDADQTGSITYEFVAQ
jgi:TonB family protein